MDNGRRKINPQPLTPFLWLPIVIGLLGVALWLTCGCGAAVRDPVVYETEIDFIQKVADEQAERAVALIDAYCECESIVDGEEPTFTTEECEKAAKTIQVIRARIGWHADMMLYLGGITEKRPDKDPPEVDPSHELCPKMSIPDVPVRPELESDGGID